MREINFILLFLLLSCVLADPPVNSLKKRLMKLCSHLYDMSCPKQSSALRRSLSYKQRNRKPKLRTEFTVATYQSDDASLSINKMKALSDYVVAIPVFQNFVEFSIKAETNAHVYLLSSFVKKEVKLEIRTYDGLWTAFSPWPCRYCTRIEDLETGLQRHYDDANDMYGLGTKIYRWYRIEWEKQQNGSMLVSVYARGLVLPVINLLIPRKLDVNVIGFGNYYVNPVTYQTRLQFPVEKQKYYPSQLASSHPVKCVNTEVKVPDWQ